MMLPSQINWKKKEVNEIYLFKKEAPPNPLQSPHACVSASLLACLQVFFVFLAYSHTYYLTIFSDFS